MKTRNRALSGLCLAVGVSCVDDEIVVVALDAGVAPPQVEVNVEVEVIGVTGPAERRRAGRWEPATVGDRLGPDDAIRTNEGGRALLGAGPSIKVQVESESEVSVPVISRHVAQVRLEKGRIGADVDDEDRALEVHSAGSTAVARAKKGRFSLFNDGKGLVAVATQRGEVALRSVKGERLVPEGSQARVVADGLPRVDKIPSSVFLKVAWPKHRRTRRQETEIRGKVDPGTRVRINETVAAVQADGTFSAKVPLEGGKNKIRVAATDLLGRQASEATTLIRPRRRRLPVEAPRRINRWE